MMWTRDNFQTYAFRSSPSIDLLNYKEAISNTDITNICKSSLLRQNNIPLANYSDVFQSHVMDSNKILGQVGSNKNEATEFLNDTRHQSNDQSNSVFEKIPQSFKSPLSSINCFACNKAISNQILCAVDRAYHSECFVCHKCNKQLEGLVFGVDGDDHILCREDYIKTYSPVCAFCEGIISPNMETGETVRVVAIGKEFHIDCYKCQDCGTHLTDEADKRCYPLDDILLCYFCHRDRKKPHRKVAGSTNQGFQNPNLVKLRSQSGNCKVDQNGNYLLSPTAI